MINPFFGIRIGRNPPERSGPAFLFANWFLIFFSLTGTVIFFVRTYGLYGNLLLLGIACFIFSVISLFVFSLLKYRWICVGVLSLLFIAVAYLRLEMLINGAQAVLADFARTLTDGMSFPGYYTPSATLSPEATRAAEHFFMVMAAFVLAMILGWAVVRVRSFTSVFAITFPWLFFGFLAEIPVDWLSTIVVIVCWLSLMLASLSAQGSPRGRAGLLLISMLAVALTIGIVSLVSPRSAYAQPQWASQSRNELLNWGVRTSGQISGGTQEVASRLGGYTIPSSDGHVSLENAGPLRYTGRTVLQVETGVEGRMYLRGHAAARYSGAAWDPLDEGALAGLNQKISKNESVFYPTYGLGDDAASSVKVKNIGTVSGVLYYPYQPISGAGDMPSATYQEDSYFKIENSLSEYTVMFRPLNFNSDDAIFWLEEIISDSYPAATGAVLDSDDKVLSAYNHDEAAYREFVYENYLEVPQGFEEKIAPWLQRPELAEYLGELSLDGSVQGVIDVARTFARMLSVTTTYDQHTPVTPEGEDFVEYFLNDSGRGYCMHYASAATLLLRQEGIPARYVSGFVFDAESGITDVPDSAAHAWVEVYLDGYGWYPVEVTAAYLTGTGEETPEDTPEDTPEETKPQPEDDPKTTPAPSKTPEQKPADTTPVDLTWLHIVLGVMAVLSLPFLFRKLLERRWNRVLRESNNNRAVIEAYGYFQQLERWGGDSGERVRELVGKARFSSHLLTAEERDEVFRLLSEELHRTESALHPLKRLFFRYVFCIK